MIVQAMWVTKSPLLQLPFVDQDTVSDLQKVKVEDIVDFMNMDDQLRSKLLKVTSSQMAQIADVCNRYPNIEMEFSLDQESYQDGAVADLTVTIRRPGVEDEDELKVFVEPVYAQYYPMEKEEQWWIVVGRPKINKLLSIKKVTNFKAVAEIQVKLNFVVQKDPDNQTVDYKVYLICDSYIGCDQEDSLQILMK